MKLIFAYENDYTLSALFVTFERLHSFHPNVTVWQPYFDENAPALSYMPEHAPDFPLLTYDQLDEERICE